jgi:hypothetical protein
MSKFFIRMAAVIVAAGLVLAACDLDDNDTYNTYDKQTSAPTGISATATSLGIIVSWNPVSDADSYTIWRSTSGPSTDSRHAKTNSTSYTDTGLSPVTTYYYQVHGNNGFGEGLFSRSASATALLASSATANEALAALDALINRSTTPATTKTAAETLKAQWSTHSSAWSSTKTALIDQINRLISTLDNNGGNEETVSTYIDSALIGTWKDKPSSSMMTAGTLLTVEFTSSTVTWTGNSAVTPNGTFNGYQSYSPVWVIKDGKIDIVYMHPANGKTSYTLYTYTINNSGELELSMAGTRVFTMVKSGGSGN